MRIVIRGGRVIDPSRGLDEVTDLVVEDGRIAALGRGLGPAGDDTNAAAVIEAAGLLVAPGFVDMHVHLRTPGQEWKEDLVTGTRAAAAGGYTSVCCMPNTVPPIDNGALVAHLRRRAAEEGAARVYPIGCVTVARAGERLADLGEMREAGAVALSDDGHPVMNAEVMRCALQYARMFDLPVSVHEEEADLAAGGVMHLGAVSIHLGLKGQPAEAETAMVARDVLLAEMTGGRLHVAHVSAAASVEIIRRAQSRGVGVTAEVTPHHLVLTDEAVEGYDTRAKCNPPARGEADRQALLEGLRDGTIAAVATDHAPHAREDKELEFDRAAFGISGLETAVGLILTEVVGKGHLDMMRAVDRLSTGPARLFGLEGGTLAPGASADVTLIDPTAEWTVDPAAFLSKGKNTPFDGRKLRGRVVMTVLGGRVVFAHGRSGNGSVEHIRHPMYINT